jgi:hypothetical protein
MMLRSSLLIAVAVVFSLSQAASAGLIQIQLGGVDLSYAGSVLSDANASGADDLTNATFLQDGSTIGVDNTEVTLDLFIPGVTGISAFGGQVNSLPNGTLDLQLGGGEHLQLALNTVEVTYLSLSGLIKFAFVGTVSSIVSQDLPYNLTMLDPVTVTFSTQIVGGYSEAANVVTTFDASGTGELQSSDQPFIPEPASLALIGLGGLLMFPRRRSAK